MSPEEILSSVKAKAEAAKAGIIKNKAISARISYVALNTSNRAGVRLVMACMLGKLHQPHVDPRKPYTEIGGNDSFSGRTYDERYLTRFINDNRLPVNPTTAFLTPTLDRVP